ncbi:MAG: hypothetical protein JSV68_10735 [Anaerolineaceae bacterium]|nr:MAG: hypothetical protein JSV68_10735 [Anaerolineaceae bacterium]
MDKVSESKCMLTVAHIVSPVHVDKKSDLFVAQPITFRTMQVARQFARDKVDVRLYSAQFEEDKPIIPPHLQQTPELERSVLDMDTFDSQRKLPLLADVLDRLYSATRADYLIYSNVDIALMPAFYTVIEQIVASGYDAFVINRRTIANHYQNDQLALMYADVGEKHPGHDCFVFRRDAYPDYELGGVCLGIRFVGRVLLWNLVCHARQFREFKDLHVTFHLGNEKTWRSDQYIDYARYNEREAMNVLATLEAKHGPLDNHDLLRPYVSDLRATSLGRRIKSWMQRGLHSVSRVLTHAEAKLE